MRTPVLTLLGIICLAAAMSWARSARHRYRLLGRIDPETAPDAYTLAWSTFRKECHSSSLYGLLALASFVNAVTEGAWGALVFSLVAIPALVSTAWARHAVREARMARQGIDIERRAQEALEELMGKLQPVNYADAKNISSMIVQLLTPRGTVNVDERTNTLIIKDIPSVIDEATALVKAVDTMTPQVMIEAKIVEASLDFSRELGSKWGFGTNPLTEATIGGRDFRPFPGTTSNVLDQVLGTGGSGVLFGNPITSATTGLFNMAAHVFDSRFNVALQLPAAESNGDGKVISSPRIVTLDNSEASIEQGVSIPFQTFENGDAQLEFVDAVLQLKVTPHITADQSIIMDIEVSRNAPDDSVVTLTGSPAISKNQVKTETLVKDGQTLVIGGIYTVTESERERSVPYLNRIPLIGAAFKSREVTDQRKELLIFVTPRIVLASELAGNGS